MESSQDEVLYAFPVVYGEVSMFKNPPNLDSAGRSGDLSVLEVDPDTWLEFALKLPVCDTQAKAFLVILGELLMARRGNSVNLSRE